MANKSLKKEQLIEENERLARELEEETKENKCLSESLEKSKELSDSLKTENEQLKESKQELTTERDELQKQIDEKEIKHLAEAYEVSAKEYRKRTNKMLRSTTSTLVVILAVSSFYFIQSIIPSWESLLIDRLNFYPIILVLFVAFFFLSKQYSFYRNLFVDMKHRQTLAQTYYNILRSVEDENIKSILAEKVVAFITTPTPHVKEDKIGTPLEAINDFISKYLSK